ncbi:tyrosine-type recombinase/integrase [Desulfogranum marinum]|uniref:tyrosine-type recombinase/integrase n=1 Tax=Desulfogranum marinum TaxID=453220 RepID=UPI0029C7694E|nr:tyrosine-type recombinase/integrase [Desulfogranum marinum]
MKKEKLKGGRSADISLLFPDKKKLGRPYSQRKVQGAMRKICASANIKRTSPHDLRHTYASWLLMDHHSPAYVQKQLGHSSIEITVGTYSHWMDGHGRPDVDTALRVEQPSGEKRILPHIPKEKAL